ESRDRRRGICVRGAGATLDARQTQDGPLSAPCGALLTQEVSDDAGHGVGLLEVRRVTGAVDRLDAGAGETPRELLGVDGRHQTILAAPALQARALDGVDALLRSPVR